MIPKNTQFTRVLALCLAVCLCLPLAACSNQPQSTTEATEADVTYTVTVQAEGGKALAEVGVFIYTDETKAELVWFDKTDATGTMTFTEAPSDNWVILLSDVPEGYQVEKSYALSQGTTQIVLKPTLLEEGDLSQITYKLGDMVHDFTVTTPDGKEHILSKLMKEKQMVVLNFWYNNCQPCKAEFPYLEEAYKKYSDVAALIGMNPVDQEDADIAAFREELELSFPMAKCDPLWEKAMQITGYPTTVVIDRFGTICLIHTGAFEDARTVESMFAYFTAVDYQPTVFESLEDLPLIEEEEDTTGTADNPIELGGITSFDVTIKPGKTKYYNLYKVDQMYLQYWQSDVYATYDGYDHEPYGGTVGFGVYTEDTYTPAKVSFTNESKKEVSFTVYLTPFAGTVNNPYSVELGEFSTTVYAGNDQGVYHIYEAEESGTFTVRCIEATPGIRYDYALYNLDTYAFRTMAEDGGEDADGVPTVSIHVNAGDEVQIIISTLPDSSNSYPGGNFTSVASFGLTDEEEKEEEKIIPYAVTVTDENRVPMAGVYLNIQTKDATTVIKTGEDGIARTKLPAGTYPTKLLIPEGYQAYTTNYYLSEAVPMFSIRLEKIVIVNLTYTIKVVDENGAAMANVVVLLGDQFGTTDEKGQISFTFEKGDYAAMVSAPAGYVAESQYPFAKDSTELTIQLKKAEQKPTDPSAPTTPSDPNAPKETSYQVTVAKYDGTPVTNVAVKFLQQGKQVAMQLVDNQGIATATLPTGDYTVELAFSQGSGHYNEKTAVLSAAAPTLTIHVAGDPLKKADDFYAGDAYYVGVGGTYAKLQKDVDNYFFFVPEESGTYQVTTTDPAAKVSFWGSSTAFISNITESTDYSEKTNSYTLNIKEAHLGGTYIIGVTGADSCILEITRIGDAVLDETDMEAEVYVAKQTPAKGISVGGTPTYVDLTSAATAVLGSDGYYHLNSADGPVLYMNLGPDAPYISMWNMLGFTGFGGTSLNKVFRDSNGVAVRKEDYTACMSGYVECITTGSNGKPLYPLTEDLIYMVQNGGEYKGWWDSTNGNYLFAELPNVNPATAWMFAVCYLG